MWVSVGGANKVRRAERQWEADFHQWKGICLFCVSSKLCHVDRVILFLRGLRLVLGTLHEDKSNSLYCQEALCLDQCVSWGKFS